MSGIQHEYTLKPVTALAFYQPADGPQLVLVGEGAFLKFIERSTARLVAQCHVFKSQTVHGIIVTDHADCERDFGAAIWGGSSFVLLTASQLDAVRTSALSNLVAAENRAPDWILAASMSTSPGFACCVFVTAHSAAFVVTVEVASGRSPLKHLPSPSRSILYSAHIIWTSSDSILVAAGTVFGEIEIIQWRSIYDESGLQSRHIFTFNGHEGSIFGVRISPEIITPDARKSRLLASCSDDRTIRIWDLSLPEWSHTVHNLSSESTSLIRETGFAQNQSSSNDQISIKRCMAVVMAHASRIWSVEFLVFPSISAESSTQVNLLSFGEDATCQHWSVEWVKKGSAAPSNQLAAANPLSITSSEEYSARFAHLNTFAYHCGKHIWAVALQCVNKYTRCLVTGGADGKVSLYDINLATSKGPMTPYHKKPVLERCTSGYSDTVGINAKSWMMEEILQEMQPNNKLPQEDISSGPKVDGLESNPLVSTRKMKNPIKTPKDSPNRYAFVTEDDLLVTTSFGRVFLVSIGQSYRWQELHLPGSLNHDLKGYSMLLGVPHHGTAFLAGSNGVIYMCRRESSIVEIARVSGKVAALLHVSSHGDGRLHIAVTTVGSEIVHLLTVDIFGSDTSPLYEHSSVMLPTNFVVTSAGEISGMLILGARNGSLALYDITGNREPLEVFRQDQAENDDAVTIIINIPTTSSLGNPSYFLVTSRDGSYSIFSLSKTQVPNGSEVLLRLVQQAFPPLGPMIEHAWFEGGNLIIYGFRSKYFVVWNETLQCEVSSVECGGAHRSYAYSAKHGIGGAGHFVYTKASKIYIHSRSKPSHKVLKTGGHGREIKATSGFFDGSDFIMATGAEDTRILIWSYKPDSQDNLNISLKCCSVVEKHTAGIQHLQWARCTEAVKLLFSAGGNEEFHVWAISLIPGFGMGVVCEATLADRSEDRDLRIMHFHVEHISGKPLADVPIKNSGLEVKGGVEGQRTGNEKYHITIAYSDSTIKSYLYSRSAGFCKVAQARYTSACLTQVTPIESGEPFSAIFTASTDGHLALWEYPFDTALQLPPDHISQSSDISNDDKAIVQPSVGMELRLLSTFQVHQSSISSYSIRHIDIAFPNRSNWKAILVATVGDDNALAITLFRIHRSNNTLAHYMKVLKRIVVPSAHAAWIPGVEFSSRKSPLITGEKGRYKYRYGLWTIGGDQRLKRWVVELELELEVIDSSAAATEAGTLAQSKIDENRDTDLPRVEIRVLPTAEEDDVPTSVADPAGLCIFRTGRPASIPHSHPAAEEAEEAEEVEVEDEVEEEHCLVYGNGLQVFKLASGAL